MGFLVWVKFFLSVPVPVASPRAEDWAVGWADYCQGEMIPNFRSPENQPPPTSLKILKSILSTMGLRRMTAPPPPSLQRGS